MPRVGLTRDSVVAEAGRIAEEVGLARLTLAALADRLVAAQGGTVHHESDRTIVEMPAAVVGAVSVS